MHQSGNGVSGVPQREKITGENALNAANFAERLHFGIAAGVYDESVVISLFLKNGYFTPAEVPENLRAEYIKTLDDRAA